MLKKPRVVVVRLVSKKTRVGRLLLPGSCYARLDEIAAQARWGITAIILRVSFPTMAAPALPSTSGSSPNMLTCDRCADFCGELAKGLIGVGDRQYKHLAV